MRSAPSKRMCRTLGYTRPIDGPEAHVRTWGVSRKPISIGSGRNETAVEEGGTQGDFGLSGRRGRSVYRLRGELQKAEDVSLEAESLCPASARTAIIVHAIVLRTRGRFDEALARMEQGEPRTA